MNVNVKNNIMKFNRNIVKNANIHVLHAHLKHNVQHNAILVVKLVVYKMIFYLVLLVIKQESYKIINNVFVNKGILKKINNFVKHANFPVKHVILF